MLCCKTRESTSSESRGLNVTDMFSGPPKQSNTTFRLRAFNEHDWHPFIIYLIKIWLQYQTGVFFCLFCFIENETRNTTTYKHVVTIVLLKIYFVFLPQDQGKLHLTGTDNPPLPPHWASSLWQHHCQWALMTESTSSSGCWWTPWVTDGTVYKWIFITRLSHKSVSLTDTASAVSRFHQPVFTEHITP